RPHTKSATLGVTCEVLAPFETDQNTDKSQHEDDGDNESYDYSNFALLIHV
ncbi:hypothetical protein Tco_1455350, partial [Tanacetum coccineum]